MEKGTEISKLSLDAEYVCTFISFSQWVNKASSWLRKYPSNGIQKIVAIDKNGDYVHMGTDFMHARDNNLFPVEVYRLVRNTEK